MIRQHIKAFIEYRPLLMEFVKRDIKVKYRNSALGIIWSMLNPLLTMGVLTFIFSNIFKSNIPNFPVFCLSGRLLYGFFSSSTNSCMKSITSKSTLIKKIYVPKYIYPLSIIMSDFIIFLISLIPLIVLMVITKVSLQKMNLLVIYPLISLFLICLGLGLILATINVFFRDLEHLYSVVLVIIMYMSAIFYSPDIIHPKYGYIMHLNPILSVINVFRDCILYGTVSHISSWIICGFYPLMLVPAGIFIFYKYQNKFIYHI